jgi:hypothetical protein
MTRGRSLLSIGASLALLVLGVSASWASANRATKPAQLSRSCPTGNAEPIQAASGLYVYDAWIGCGSIGFARSTDGGRKFGPATTVPSPGFADHEWDPAVAVAPDGTVYVAFMAGGVVTGSGGGEVSQYVPAVAASTDHGATFSRVSALPLPAGADSKGNWGDRDFIAIGPDGTVYVTWDYGPPGDPVKIRNSPGGSDWYTAGEFNAVVQKSSDGGRTWTDPASVSPGFPLGGAYSAPIVAEPDGTLDVLYWQHPTDPDTLAVSPGHEYFTRSTDGGATWSTPVAVDPGAGTIGLAVWWIDGSLAVDSAGNLYAAWDTQAKGHDTAWLAWSSDGGQHWSRRLRVTSSKRRRGVKLENLVEVAAAGRRDVYLGWQTVSTHGFYATYLRRLSVGHGWTSRAVKISTGFADARGWPGDTIGISVEPSGAAVLSWGQTGTGVPDIYAAVAKLP